MRNGRPAATSIVVRAEVRDAEGKTVLSLKQTADLAAGADQKVRLNAPLPNPRRWEPGYPHVYRVALTLSAAGETVDSVEVPFGVRAARWDVNSGLWLNGVHYKLHG